jgi:hypothetical protein
VTFLNVLLTPLLWLLFAVFIAGAARLDQLLPALLAPKVLLYIAFYAGATC